MDSGLSFEAFVAARGGALLRYAFMLTHDAGRAEDLVQDALVKVHRRWGRVAAAEQPDAYVRRVVTNEFLSWRRRRSSSETPSLVSTAAVVDPALAVDDRDQMWRALATLPHRQRMVMVLRFYEELTDPEIAGLLDCAVGTVSSLASRALGSLRTLTWTSDPDPTSPTRREPS
jgi:RNA polymerase sigma-70 factor (sigma-E family)